MRPIDFSRDRASPIEEFGSAAAASVPLGSGEGESHVYCVHFEPGGVIGPHPAGFCQLFLAIAGEGWAAGGDGVRVAIAAGHGVYIERGERHSKGSDSGMTAIMVQVERLEPSSESLSQESPAALSP